MNKREESPQDENKSMKFISRCKYLVGWDRKIMSSSTERRKNDFFFFFEIGFIISSFLSFVFFYTLIFPEKAKEDLVNPLQVVAQLSCFFFLFKYSKKEVRVRHLLLLSFVGSLASSLYLQGCGLAIVICFLIGYCYMISKFPLTNSDSALFFLVSGYSLDQGLAQWGFYMAFQLFCHFLLASFLEKQNSFETRTRLLSFVSLLFFLLAIGGFLYGQFYLSQLLKLGALLSGASIIFISLKRRPLFQISMAFLIYFFISLLIGISNNTTQIWPVQSGLLIFIFFHFWALLALVVFQRSLPIRKQPLVPLFFGCLFFMLGEFPELAWLEKWVSGIDLLLLIISIFAFIEEESDYESREGSSQDRTLRSLSNHLVEESTKKRTENRE